MARSRNIKPGFFDNEVLGELPALTRLLFIGLWCLADREGRLHDRPKRIKKELLGYDDVTADDVDTMLQQLDDNGFITRYRVENEQYIQVINFLKHQNPHCKEQASVIPPPGGNVTGNQTDETSREMGLGVVADHVKGRTESTSMDSESSHTDRDLQTSPADDEQETGKDTENKPARKAASPDWKTAKTPLEIGFCKFWDAYPNVRKRAKPACWRKWQVIKPDEAMLEQMLRTIQAYSQTSEWKRGYVPMPLTWLNQGRWEDECMEVEGNGEYSTPEPGGRATAGFHTTADY
jgi:hypothetical protein